MKYIVFIKIMLSSYVVLAQDYVAPRIEGVDDYSYLLPVDAGMVLDVRNKYGHNLYLVDRVCDGDVMYSLYRGGHINNHIEAVDISSATVLWTTYIGWREEGYEVFMRSIEAVDEETITVLGDRRIHDRKVMVDKYVIDRRSGKKRNPDHGVLTETDYEIISEYKHIRDDSSYVSLDLFSANYVHVREFDYAQKLLAHDSIALPSEGPLYIPFHRLKNVGDKRMILYAHKPQDVTTAEYTATKDADVLIFDAGYRYQKAVKVRQEELPYGWDIAPIATTEDYFIIRSIDRHFENKDEQRTAVMLMDTSGQIVSTLDFGTTGDVELVASSTSDGDAIVIASYSRGENRLRFYRVDPGSDDYTLLSDRKVEDAGWAMSLTRMDILPEKVVLSIIKRGDDFSIIHMNLFLDPADVGITTSVVDQEVDDLVVSPIPAHYTVDVERAAYDSDTRYTIYNGLGSAVAHGYMGSGRIDLSVLPTGIYFLQVQGHTGLHKIIKQ